ncbi:MAG TPA: protein kinase [Thermoanaerobaculia bacterium]|jgi:Tol biopolymer transport system component/serine/threonine protein kinase
MSVLTAGTRIGPYEIVARIGAGGMSEVYRAFDPRIRRDVAVKVLPPQLAKFADRLHRFEQEARAVGALNHPNLLTIFDTGKSEGRPYIVTELLEGHTLRSLLRDNGTAVRLPVRKAVDYGIQIANGLAAAHERGIVHRDLKPENLFVTRDGRVKILDFGVAKLRTAEDEELSDEDTMEQDTSPGTVIGTVGYMSPEQVRGQAVDGRSDIFSLGTLLFEMVAGEHPFRGNSPADTMSAILREDPRDLTPINPNVTPGLERVIRHCMEKSPEQRFQSARDLAFHLDMLSSASGSAPTLESSISDTWNRPLVGILGVLALLAAGLALGWLVRSGVGTKAAPQLHFAQLTFEQGIEIQPSLAPDGETFVFARGNGPQADIFLQRVNGRNAIKLTGRCAQADIQPAFSPDGSQIAYRSDCEGGGIFVMGATGESSRRITGSCFNPSWSPDGKRIVCATETTNYTPTARGQMSELWIVDASNGERKLLLSADGVQPAWSPNGHRIAYWGISGQAAQRDIWTIDPSAEDPVKSIVRVTEDAAVDWNPVWSPDGQHLYFGSDRNGAMNLWRIRIDEKSGKPKGEPESVTTPARASAHYSPAKNGGRMLYASIDQEESLRVVPIDPVAGTLGGEPRSVLAGSFIVFSAQVSPDARFVAVTNRGVQEDLFIVEIATGEIRQLTSDSARDRGAIWSPDGKQIYFYSQRSGDQYEIWRINADGSGLTRITTSKEGSAWYPAISPDGSKLSFYNYEHTYLLDLKRAGAEIETLPAAMQGSRPALNAWSPDGTMLAGELRGRPGIMLYDTRGRTYHGPITPSGARPIWLPGGQEILYSDAGKLRIVHVETRAIRDVATPLTITNQSLSADGRTLVYSDRQTEADIWMAELPAKP